MKAGWNRANVSNCVLIVADSLGMYEGMTAAFGPTTNKSALVKSSNGRPGYHRVLLSWSSLEPLISLDLFGTKLYCFRARVHCYCSLYVIFPTNFASVVATVRVWLANEEVSWRPPVLDYTNKTLSILLAMSVLHRLLKSSTEDLDYHPECIHG